MIDHHTAQLDRNRGEVPASQPDFERTQAPGVRYDHTGRPATQRRTGITPTHAKARALVRLPDGRTARLIHVNPYGKGAKVRTQSGAYLHTTVDVLELVDEETG